MERSVRYSKKREAILTAIRGTGCHPSAEWLYQQLKPRHPDLSLGTVYRNLNHLCGHGLIRRVGPVNGQERYDGTLSPHSHFICNRCGAILDLPQRSPGQSWLESVGVQYGFQAKSCEFIVRGLCRACGDEQPDAQILTLEEKLS